MKPTPRIILGIATSVLIVASIILITVFLKKDQSYILLNSQKNGFNLNFSISKADQDNFQNILSSVGITQDVKDGVYFELDSTSSAKLNFLTPIKTDLRLSKNKTIDYLGATSIPVFSNQLEIDQIKVPKTTNVAIFAPNLKNFVKSRLNIPQNVSSWIDKNLSAQNGSYLIIYDSNPDYSLLVKEGQISFDELKALKDSSGSTIYKEESNGDIKLNYLQVPGADFEEQQTLTFFKLGDYQVMSSSPDAAKSLIEAQNSLDSQKFPGGNKISDAAIVTEYSNPDENKISDKAVSFLLEPWETLNSPKAKIANSLKQIKNASFILKEQSFSGLINLK